MKRPLLGFVLFLVLVIAGLMSCSSPSNGPTTRVTSDPPVKVDLPPQFFMMSTGDVTAELSAIRVLLVSSSQSLTWANYHAYFFAAHTPTTGADPNVSPCPFNSWNEDWGMDGNHPWPPEVTGYFTGYNYLVLDNVWYQDGK